jgi:hypothetical protein
MKPNGNPYHCDGRASVLLLLSLLSQCDVECNQHLLFRQRRWVTAALQHRVHHLHDGPRLS